MQHAKHQVCHLRSMYVNSLTNSRLAWLCFLTIEIDGISRKFTETIRFAIMTDFAHRSNKVWFKVASFWMKSFWIHLEHKIIKILSEFGANESLFDLKTPWRLKRDTNLLTLFSNDINSISIIMCTIQYSYSHLFPQFESFDWKHPSEMKKDIC